MQKTKTMTLNLSAAEMAALDRLAEARGLTKTALLRQALRLYASVTERVDRGDKLFVEPSDGKEKAELMVLG